MDLYHLDGRPEDLVALLIPEEAQQLQDGAALTLTVDDAPPILRLTLITQHTRAQVEAALGTALVPHGQPASGAALSAVHSPLVTQALVKMAAGERLPLVDCSLCGYTMGFFMRGSQLLYDNACHCGGSPGDPRRVPDALERYVSQPNIARRWGLVGP
jgi:hypothetical protein